MVNYSVLRGRGGYQSGNDYIDGSIASNSDSTGSISLFFLNINSAPCNYGCKEISSTNNIDCTNAGYYFQGSGMYGTSYQMFNLSQNPSCNDWDIVYNYSSNST